MIRPFPEESSFEPLKLEMSNVPADTGQPKDYSIDVEGIPDDQVLNKAKEII